MATGTTGPTGSAGPSQQDQPKSFFMRSRTTAAIVEEVVSAMSREEAITAKIAALATGEDIDVMKVEEVPPGYGASGATGATGAAATTGPTGATGP